MTTKDFAGGADAPGDSEMRFYARAYTAQKGADELFLKWEVYQAHAALLMQAPERFYEEYRLNGRQLAEGALIAMRRMALLLAEEPTRLREVLGLKVHAYETMGQRVDEVAQSHAVIMLEVAMKADADRLGIVMLPLPAPFGRTQ
jgi:hypothetical protein